jgi:ATP-dependent DNA helicase RecQ
LLGVVDEGATGSVFLAGPPGLVELRAAEVRQRYTVTAMPDAQDELVDRLLERFARRERSETERIQSVLALVTHNGCQVQALVAYFGETRAEPCTGSGSVGF